MYYELISSPDELVGSEGFLRLPSYIYDEYVFDDARKLAMERVLNWIASGYNVLIVGRAGAGKTAFLAMVLKSLMDRGYRIGKVINGEVIRRDHESQGVIIFYDDVPRMDPRTIRSLVENGARLFIGTARTEELSDLAAKLGDKPENVFKVVYIGEMSESRLREILYRFAKREGIEIDPEAADIVIAKAERLPVYIWQVIRDLIIMKRSKLDVDFARRIPQGMIEYVDRILWNAIGESEDRLEVLLTLITMTLMPEYEMHQDLFNAVFLEATKVIKNIENPPEIILLKSKTLDRVRRYLVKTPHYSFRLPHDSWADVLKGRSTGLLSSEISKLLFIFPPDKLKQILKDAIIRAYNDSISKTTDPTRVREFFRQINLLGMGKVIVDVPGRISSMLPAAQPQPISPMKSPPATAQVQKPIPPQIPQRPITPPSKQISPSTPPRPVSERHSVVLFGVSRKLINVGSGYNKKKLSELSVALLNSKTYRDYCGLGFSQAVNQILFSRRPRIIELKYPCWKDLSIKETIEKLQDNNFDERIIRFLVMLFIAAIMAAIPFIGILIAIFIVWSAINDLVNAGKIYFVKLEIEGPRATIRSLAREIRANLGRNPVRISPKIDRVLIRKKGLDPSVLERSWLTI